MASESLTNQWKALIVELSGIFSSPRYFTLTIKMILSPITSIFKVK